MEIVIVLRVEVERDEGKFASREAIEELILDEVTSADPGSIDPDEATYSTTMWEAEVHDPKTFDKTMAAGTKVLAEAKGKREARSKPKATVPGLSGTQSDEQPPPRVTTPEMSGEVSRGTREGA
jgi:hypothetical protein